MPPPIREQSDELGKCQRLGERLHRFRRQCRFTQRGLWRASNVTWATVQRLESWWKTKEIVTKPSPDVLRDLAWGLASDPDDETTADLSAARRFYIELMCARGYLEPDDCEAVTALAPVDVNVVLVQQLGDKVGKTICRLIERLPTLDTRERDRILLMLSDGLDGADRRRPQSA